jgi:hypothetical protein
MEETSISNLNFIFTTSIEINSGLFTASGGMTSSESTNSLYLARRHKGREFINTYNLSTDSWTEYTFDFSSFSTKRLHIIDDQLILF